MDKHVQSNMRKGKTAETILKWIWRPAPFLTESAIVPVLYLLPSAVFLLFILLISGLSAAE